MATQSRAEKYEMRKLMSQIPGDSLAMRVNQLKVPHLDKSGFLYVNRTKVFSKLKSPGLD